MTDSGREKKSSRKKRFLLCFLILLGIGFLLAGGYNVRGHRVVFCTYNEEVVSHSQGYLVNGQSYIYTGEEDSCLLIQRREDMPDLLLKFQEEAVEDVPVIVSLQDINSQELAQENVVWEKGTCFLEILSDIPDAAMMELHIPSDFTVERAMYSLPFYRIKHAAVLYAGVIILALFLAFLLVGRQWDRKLAGLLRSVWRRLRNSLRKENWKACAPVWGAFILILLVGSLYVWSEPAMLGLAPDEQNHYRETAEMAHPFRDGIALSDYDEFICVSSQTIPKNIYTKEGRAQYGRYLNAIDRKGYEITALWNEPFIFIRAAYLPYVLVYTVARTLHLPWTVRFILGRWVMVGLFALLCAAGMRHLKSGRLLVLMLAITPAIIFLSANYGYDTWMTGWYIYGLCVLFGEIQRPQQFLRKKTAAGILIALFLADLPKLIYFPVNAIAFFMPHSKFAGKKGYWLYKAAAALQVAVLLVLLYFRSFAGGMGAGDVRGGDTVNAAEQIRLAIAEPARFTGVILHALKSFANPFYSVRGWGNLLGYMGTLRIGIIIVILILAAIVFSWARKEEGRFPWWYRLGVFAVYIGISVLILVSMYASFTPVGADYVAGAQHRYLIPLLFPLFFVLTRFSGGRILTGRKVRILSHSILLAIMVALNIYALWSFCWIRY